MTTSRTNSAVSLFLSGLTLMALLLSTATASAATRKVCFNLGLHDDSRTDCPWASANWPGARRPCRSSATGQTSRDWMVGHVISVWDKDYDGLNGAGDELIGNYVITAPGRICVTFEWENASYSLGEAHPDVYIKVTNTVRASWGASSQYPQVTGTINGAAIPDPSWRGSDTSDATVAVNCPTNTNCSIGASNLLLVPYLNNSTGESRALLALDTAQRMLEIFGAQMDSAPIFMDMGLTQTTCGAGFVGCAPNRNRTEIQSGWSTNGNLATHELGHILHKRAFEQDNIMGPCPNAYNAPNNNSCATTEGWADYVAAASWYDPNAGPAEVWQAGYNLEESIDTSMLSTDGSCSQLADIPWVAARWFWDLDDSRQDTRPVWNYVDTSNRSTTGMAGVWDLFEDGTANRQDTEGNFADLDAPNLYDYEHVLNLHYADVDRDSTFNLNWNFCQDQN